MRKIKAILGALRGLSPRNRALAAVGVAVVAALIVALCISINMRANIQRDYDAVSGRMGETLYYNLNMLKQSFDMTAVPSADIRNSVLPQMHEYFLASVTLNDLLKSCYGAKYSVLSETDINALRAAFDAYDAAYASDASTDLAQADMQRCMETVREILQTRFSGMTLKPAR